MRFLKFSAVLILICSFLNPASGMDIKRWLEEIGLEEYYPNFVDNAITDEETLKSVTEDDLKSIGITSLGHRKRLLSAISEVKTQGWQPRWDLKYWLQSIYMDEYYPNFVENSITDRETIATLSEDDLKSIGIASLGHRRKLMSAIASLSKTGEIASDVLPRANNNIVVEVHQSHVGSNMWYRVGVVDPTAKTIDWGESHKYDIGRLPMCDFDGNTIVEVHEGHDDLSLWYRVGTVEEKTRTINWKRSVNYDDRGRSPVIAIRGNIAVEMHQSHDGTDLWYHVGILDRATGFINWSESKKFDRGKIPSIGFPELELNTIVEVHQSHVGTNLWYHVGIVDPASRTIHWGESHQYDVGRLPMCDFDGNTIVEVHQGHDDLQLWYRVGTVEERTRTIAWGRSVNYDRGKIPTVAINDNIVVEMHQSHEGTELWYNVGILDKTTRTIEWGQGHRFGMGRIPSVGF